MTTYSEANGWFDWAYKGVDHSFPGNGGIACRDFLSLSQRCWESVFASIVALVALLYAYPRLRLPRPNPCIYHQRKEPLGKRILLLLMCLTFGIELGFKLATRQMIWIGNPCHLATMMQIFILAAPPSRIVTAAFRLHMHMLTGAPIAILFPVINTRLLPFETGVYFLQHILMLVIPFYLMAQGDPFIPEALGDFSWAMVSFGFLFIYHFLPLQFLAYVSQVNLNNMLCPAVSDPFHGRFYRLFAICHQLILIPSLGKLFVIIARAFGLLPCDNPPDETCITEAFACTTRLSDTCLCFSTASRCSSVTQTYSGDMTDADSGCVGSNSLTNRSAERNLLPAACCCGDSYGRSSAYSCGGYRRNSCCSNSENVGSVKHIVNGEMVSGGGTAQEVACCCHRHKDSSQPEKENGSCFQRSFLLKDPSDTDHNEEADKSLRRSDLEKTQNGHAKSH